MMQKLVDQHRIATPIQTTTYLKKENGDSLKLSTQKTTYKAWDNGLVLPEYLQTAKGTDALENRVQYESYDAYGNPRQVRQVGGTPTTYLWGYDGQYLIAKIEGATYNEVETALGGLSTIDESHLSQIDSLRSTKTQWLITTYRHQPLVGVTEIIAPNGIATAYEYDGFNRLWKIKDNLDKTIKEYTYHYANTSGTNVASTPEEEETTDVLDTLGTPLQNPYSVANMRKALTGLLEKNTASRKTYSGKTLTSINEITTSDYYVRFLVKQDAEYQTLVSDSLELSITPLDREYSENEMAIIDTQVPTNDEEQWFYTAVPKNYVFPTGITYEILEDLFLIEPAYSVKGHTTAARTANVDIEFLYDLEDESLRLNESNDMGSPTASKSSSKGKETPEGYFYVANTAATKNSITAYTPDVNPAEDPDLNENGDWDFGDGGLVPVAYKEPIVGVKVKARRWFKWAKGWTDGNGYYKMNRGYRKNPKYTVVFKNTIGFKVRHRFISFSAGRHHAGRHSNRGYTVTFATDSRTWRLATVNNATVKYFDYCEQLGITKPPTNLRIQAHDNGGGGGAAPMLRRLLGVMPTAIAAGGTGYWIAAGTTTPLSIKITAIISAVAAASQLVVPDVMINANNPARDTEEVYEAVFHEIGHASHYAVVGNSYWINYVTHIATNIGYGKGTEKNAGYTGVGEMWGEFIGGTLADMEFKNSTIEEFLNSGLNWYNPGFLYDVVNEIEDLTIAEVFECLTKDVNTIEKLVAELKTKTEFDEEIDEKYKFYKDWPKN